MIKIEQPSAFRLVRELKTSSNYKRTLHISARRQTGYRIMGARAQHHGELLPGWESKWKVGQGGQRGCVVQSLLLYKEVIFFLMLEFTGPEWILSVATKVEIHNGVPRSDVLQLYPLTSFQKKIFILRSQNEKTRAILLLLEGANIFWHHLLGRETNRISVDEIMAHLGHLNCTAYHWFLSVCVMRWFDDVKKRLPVLLIHLFCT